MFATLSYILFAYSQIILAMNILKLKKIMSDRGISGRILAEQVGVSQTTITNIVQGHNFPRPALLLAIAEALEVDLPDLFVHTLSKDLTDPVEAIKEIRRIVFEVGV